MLAGLLSERDFQCKTGMKPVSFKTPSSKPEILKRINGPLVISNMTSYPEINADAYKDAGFRVN